MGLAKAVMTFYKYYLDSADADDMVANIHELDRPSQMITLSVLAELDGKFKHGDPLQTAIDACSLSDEDIETAMLCKAEWIEDNYTNKKQNEMEENLNTIEELNATIAALKSENEALKSENEDLKDEVANLKENLGDLHNSADAAKKDLAQMRDWWTAALTEKDRIKGVIKAIGTLVNAIQ